MHGVSKICSTSTKLRPVCDASSKSTTGVSLNDQLLPGPSLYPRIWSIINQFRCHQIAMTADISKMCRQVGLNPEERDFHRYLHRDDSGKIRDHRMTRLTFGVSSSPFLATQVLRQLASDHQDEHPAAAQAVRQSFYVDDLLAGADSVTASQHLRRDLNNLLDKACMPLCKWRSNSADLMSSIPSSLHELSDLTRARQLSENPGNTLEHCHRLPVHRDSRHFRPHTSHQTDSCLHLCSHLRPPWLVRASNTPCKGFVAKILGSPTRVGRSPST